MVGISEYKSQIEHILEDLVQLLRDGKYIYKNLNNDNNDTVDHSEIQSNTNYDAVSEELSKYFDLELSNKKQKQAKKLLLEYKGVKLMERKLLYKSSNDFNFCSFKIKWMQKKRDRNGETCEEKEENYSGRITFIDDIKSYVNHDESKYGITCNNNDEIVCIINSYDRTVHPVTKYCDRTILTQSISILTPPSIQNNIRNLAKRNNLLIIMSTNGKEDIKTLDNIFEHYFQKKYKVNEITNTLHRNNNSNNVLILELYDIKFTYTMYNRNWNHSYYPFLGCYYQRGDSFNLLRDLT